MNNHESSPFLQTIPVPKPIQDAEVEFVKITIKQRHQRKPFRKSNKTLLERKLP